MAHAKKRVEKIIELPGDVLDKLNVFAIDFDNLFTRFFCRFSVIFMYMYFSNVTLTLIMVIETASLQADLSSNLPTCQKKILRKTKRKWVSFCGKTIVIVIIALCKYWFYYYLFLPILSPGYSKPQWKIKVDFICKRRAGWVFWFHQRKLFHQKKIWRW